MSYVQKDTGYIRTYVGKAHPLASSNGHIYVHRLVLFERIGYGPHLCAINGEHINWGAGLETDHINGNRADNRPDNLRAVCLPCNRMRRTWKPADQWKQRPSRKAA